MCSCFGLVRAQYQAKCSCPSCTFEEPILNLRRYIPMTVARHSGDAPSAAPEYEAEKNSCANFSPAPAPLQPWSSTPAMSRRTSRDSHPGQKCHSCLTYQQSLQPLRFPFLHTSFTPDSHFVHTKYLKGAHSYLFGSETTRTAQQNYLRRCVRTFSYPQRAGVSGVFATNL